MLKRWLVMGLVLVAIGAAAWFTLPDPIGKVSEGQIAPDFVLNDMNGKPQHLPRGKVVLLNFWATWCPPCREEMPSMIKMYKSLASRGLMVVAASVDKNEKQLAGFVREYEIPFEVLKDNTQKVSRSYGVVRYPETFLIDRTGKVRYHLIGAVKWTDPSVLQTINGLLSEKTPG